METRHLQSEYDKKQAAVCTGRTPKHDSHCINSASLLHIVYVQYSTLTLHTPFLLKIGPAQARPAFERRTTQRLIVGQVLFAISTPLRFGSILPSCHPPPGSGPWSGQSVESTGQGQRKKAEKSFRSHQLLQARRGCICCTGEACVYIYIYNFIGPHKRVAQHCLWDELGWLAEWLAWGVPKEENSGMAGEGKTMACYLCICTHYCTSRSVEAEAEAEAEAGEETGARKSKNILMRGDHRDTHTSTSTSTSRQSHTVSKVKEIALQLSRDWKQEWS
jgi:hypothetical protein